MRPTFPPVRSRSPGRLRRCRPWRWPRSSGVARAGSTLPLAEGLALEKDAFAKVFATADAREGLAAFLDKRTPKFTGE